MKFLFPLSLIIVAGILFFVVVNPIRAEVSKLKADVAIYNIALDNSTELQKTRDKLMSAYSNISQTDKDRLSHFLPNTVNNIRFILEIEQLANLHSMPVENIKFQTQQNAPEVSKNNSGAIVASGGASNALPYGVFPVEFSTKGTYESFGKFLSEIEHNLRLVDIKSVSFSVPDSKQNGTDPNVYEFLLKVETYWLK